MDGVASSVTARLWLLPRRALPGERLTRKPPPRPRAAPAGRALPRALAVFAGRLDGVASSVTARLAAPSLRLARRTPHQENRYPACSSSLLASGVSHK